VTLVRCYFCLIIVVIFQVALSQNTTPWQRLEFVCANNVSLTHVIAAPEQITLIFNDAFYPMKQVGTIQDAGESVRYEDGKNLIWITEDGVGRLEQKDGKVLAQACVYQSETPVLAYICIEDVTVEVEYVNDVAQIKVFDPVYGDQTYELPKVAWDAGAKFSDGMTTWFVKGEDANLFEETEEVQHAQQCKLNP
jgi:membrane-bound inhibitor of C-type lysozyme